MLPLTCQCADGLPVLPSEHEWHSDVESIVHLDLAWGRLVNQGPNDFKYRFGQSLSPPSCLLPPTVVADVEKADVRRKRTFVESLVSA